MSYQVWIKNNDGDSVLLVKDQTRRAASDLVRKLTDVGATVVMKEQGK